MDDLKSTNSPTSGVTPQSPATQTSSTIGGQAIPEPTLPETAPTAPPTIQPEKPPESPPQIITPQTTTTETAEEKSGLSGRFPKPSRKKIIAGLGVFLVVILGGISVGTAWKLRQTEKVIPEEAEAWVGNACSGDCEIVVGPGKFSFVAAGHGMRDVKRATISVNLPAGTEGYEAYAFWSGEGEWPYNDTSIKVNSWDVNAIKIFSAKNPKFGTSQIANLGKIPNVTVRGKTGKIDFNVTGLDNLNSDDRPGSGHGIGVVVIYTGDNVSQNKIILRLWGEWLYMTYAAFDSGVGANKSAVMQINLPDLDHSRRSDNKFVFFFGEGEKRYESCQDEEGRGRPSHLFYKTVGDWTRLDAKTGVASQPWPACPLPENIQPGQWWATRITGRDLTSITLSGSNINFTADSLIREEGGKLGDSITFVGAVAQYPIAAPPPPPGCWETCTNDGDCPKTPNVLLCQDVAGAKRCVNPVCPSQENCECPPLLCLDLATSSTEFGEGDEVELTCKGSYNSDHPVNYAEFRFLVDGEPEGDVERIDAAANNGEYEAVLGYTIPKTGGYRIECRVCGEFVSVSYENGNVASSVSFKCTEWGKAGIANP